MLDRHGRLIAAVVMMIWFTSSVRAEEETANPVDVNVMVGGTDEKSSDGKLSAQMMRTAGILKADVFAAYPDQTKAYDSNLKRQAFLESDDGKQLKTKIVDDRKSLTSVSQIQDLCEVSSSYSLKTKSFECMVDQVNSPDFQESQPGLVHSVFFASLKSRVETGSMDMKFQKLRLSVPKELAAKIEEAKDVTVRAVYRLTGVVKAVSRPIGSGRQTIKVPGATILEVVLVTKDRRELGRLPATALR